MNLKILPLNPRVAAGMVLIAVWGSCCLLGQSWLKGTTFFVLVLGLAWVRGKAWGVGGHTSWGTPGRWWRTGACAPGCPACPSHVDVTPKEQYAHRND